MLGAMAAASSCYNMPHAGSLEVLVNRITALIILLVSVTACNQQSEPSSNATAPPTRAASLPSGTLVDLSHAYDDKSVFWPTAEKFRLEKVNDGVTPAGYYYAANNFFSAEHGGTHVDAPLHFAKGRHAVDQIPLNQLTGRAVVVDVTAACEKNPDYLVTAADLQEWEKANGKMPDGAMLLLRTGFSKHWPDAKKYLGTDERGEAAVPKLHFPGLHPDAARWIVANRIIKALGIDTASIDYGQSTDFQTHQVIYAQDVPGFENLTNLDRLPPVGAYIIALPMKIAGGSGAPLRAIAFVP
jgi:kynurenine formamidase